MVAQKAPKKPMDRLRKEIKAQADNEAGAVTVPLVGRAGSEEIEVQPLLDWGDEWRTCLEAQDLRGWAHAALDEENFATWCACAPTIRQALDFVTIWGDAAGADLGESQAS